MLSFLGLELCTDRSLVVLQLRDLAIDHRPSLRSRSHVELACGEACFVLSLYSSRCFFEDVARSRLLLTFGSWKTRFGGKRVKCQDIWSMHYIPLSLEISHYFITPTRKT